MSKAVLKTQLEFTHYMITATAAGTTHEESLAAPPGGGNCLNWVLGHILVSRGQILEVLGDRGVLTDEQAEPYRRGSEPLRDGSAVLPLSELLTAVETSQERIQAQLERLDDAALARVLPESPFGREQETVETMLAALIFHEAYHAGQMGLLRRLAGLEGTVK
jgi:uncharacterized damage-inducible protein DinB